jgi:hypothetical protein
VIFFTFFGKLSGQFQGRCAHGREKQTKEGKQEGSPEKPEREEKRKTGKEEIANIFDEKEATQ